MSRSVISPADHNHSPPDCWYRRRGAARATTSPLGAPPMALATANPAALRARAETAPRPYWVWSGYAAFILGVLFTWAPAFFGVSEAESKDPDRLFRALDTTTNLWIGRVSSGLGFLAVAAVIVFATGYRRFLEARMKDSLVPAVAFTALVATAGALIVASIFRAMLFDSIDYYDNSVHAAF